MRAAVTSSPGCLGFAEIPFFSPAAVASDAMAKAANVRVLGLEPSGGETILIRIAAPNPGDVTAALAEAAAVAARMGSEAVTSAVPAPADAIPSLNTGPLSHNPLYGGRVEMRPDDFQPNLRTTMNDNIQALGILETQGLTASLEAADAMLKAASVQLVGKEKIGAAYVTIIVRGRVADVKAAVEAGSQAVGNLGRLIAAHVIARPHEDLLALLPG